MEEKMEEKMEHESTNESHWSFRTRTLPNQLIVEAKDSIINEFQVFHSYSYKELIQFFLKKDLTLDILLQKFDRIKKTELSLFIEEIHHYFFNREIHPYSPEEELLLGLAHWWCDEQQLILALICFESAAQAGHDSASFYLCWCNLLLSRDKLSCINALNGIEEVAKKGSSLALYSMGLINLGVPIFLANNKDISNFVSKIDEKKALEYLQEAGEKDNPCALNSLGIIYLQGRYNIEVNHEKAKFYALKAIKKGNGDAFLILAELATYENNPENQFHYLMQALLYQEPNPDPEDKSTIWIIRRFCEEEKDINKQSYYYRYIIEKKSTTLMEWAESKLLALYHSNLTNLVVCYHTAQSLTNCTDKEKQEVNQKLKWILSSTNDDLNILLEQEVLTLSDLRFRRHLVNRIDAAYRCLTFVRLVSDENSLFLTEQNVTLMPELILMILELAFGEYRVKAVLNGTLLAQERQEERAAYVLVKRLENTREVPDSSTPSIISTLFSQTFWGNTLKRKIDDFQEGELMKIKSAHEEEISYVEAAPSNN